MTANKNLDNTLHTKMECLTAGNESDPLVLMYAIAFDFDTRVLKDPLIGVHTEGYKLIETVLGLYGFERKQGSVYYGNSTVTMVSCYLAVDDLTKKLSWFADAVKDIRVLQLVGNDDLRPIIERCREKSLPKRKLKRRSAIQNPILEKD